MFAHIRMWLRATRHVHKWGPLWGSPGQLQEARDNKRRFEIELTVEYISYGVVLAALIYFRVI